MRLEESTVGADDSKEYMTLVIRTHWTTVRVGDKFGIFAAAFKMTALGS
jgi:hypothetical protein